MNSISILGPRLDHEVAKTLANNTNHLPNENINEQTRHFHTRAEPRESWKQDTIPKIATRPQIRRVRKGHDVSYDLDTNPDRIVSDSLDSGFEGPLGRIR